MQVFFFPYCTGGDKGCLNPSVTKKEQMEPEGEWDCSCCSLLSCVPSQLGAGWAHLWPAAQAPSGARGCPWASGGWGFTARVHHGRGLSQASPIECESN